MRTVRTILLTLWAGSVMPVTSGCWRSANPETITIELPDGSTITATVGAGVPSLANSTWEFFIVGPGGTVQTEPFFIATFGPEGKLTRIDQNPISPEIFGDTIYFDGRYHSTQQPGLTYTAEAYAAGTNEDGDFGFVGTLNALAAGFPAANATATATGAFDPDDPDTMTGVFAFSLDVTLAFVPGGDAEESHEFVAHRVID